jgi:PAS domain S-box-containing protein
MHTSRACGNTSTSARKSLRQPVGLVDEARVLFEAAPFSAMVVDRQGTVLMANRAAARAFGRSAGGLEGSCLYQRLPQELSASLRRYVAGVLRTGRPAEFENVARQHYHLYFLFRIGARSARNVRVAILGRDISAMKKAELALQGSLEELETQRDRWQATLESMVDAVAVCDAKGCLTYLNPAYSNLVHRRPRAQLKVRDYPRYYKLYRPDGTLFKSHDLPLQRAARTGKVVPATEVISRAPDGTVRTAIWSAAPFEDTTGRTAGAVAIGHDVTHLKRAERLLAQSNLELERTVQERTAALAERAALLELSFDAILVRDQRDRITYWNRGAEELYGWRREEVLGRVSHDLFQTKFPEPLRQIMDKLRQEGRWSGELIHTRRDGLRVIVATRWALQTDRGGHVAVVLETNTDITERKQAEESLRRREQELMAFFELSPLGLLWVAPDGRVLRVNPAALELLGRSGKEVQGVNLVEFCADLDGPAALLQRLGRGELITNYRLRFWHKAGLLKHVLIDADALWEKDRMIYSRWFVRDITQRIELEQEILAISEREQRRIGQDLHDDLCQQLSGVEFLSQTLAAGLGKEGRPEAAQLKEVAAMVRHALVQTRDLARGLSPLSLEADGLMLALTELAARTAKLFGADCQFLCSTPVLVPDQTIGVHVYRIAQEAVGNAIKHGKAKRIQIRLTAAGSGFVLEVNDDGKGISPAPGHSEGMGLRIMRHRAGVIGGSLSVQRLPTGGTSVRCDMPGRVNLPISRSSR